MSERKKMDPKRLHDQLIITGLAGLIEDEGMTFHEAMEVLDDIKRQTFPALMQMSQESREGGST